MPFFRRYAAGFLTADSGDTVSFVDTDLTQVDDFWKRTWVYRIASQEVSQIVKFNARLNQVFLEAPITSMTGSSLYEIHSLWNALEIHKAINDAIHDVERVFVDTVTDETFVIQEDVREYDLTALTRDPYLVNKIWIESPSTVRRGRAVSGGATTITLESSSLLTDVNTSWMISIYAGTGKGQVRSIVSVLGAQATVAAWTTNPDSTSKYALWDASRETYDWYPFPKIRFDAKEFPSLMYFAVRPTSFYGMRIRVEYSALPVPLTTEASTTTVPESYITFAAMAKLHSDRVGDNRADRDLHFGESKRFEEMAAQYLMRNTPHRPDRMIFTASDGAFQPDMANPLNWE
jgi:hypothetical protein